MDNAIPLPAGRLLTPQQVLDFVGLKSKKTLYRWLLAGKFPPPVRFKRLGLRSDIASLTLVELWGLYQRLSRMGG